MLGLSRRQLTALAAVAVVCMATGAAIATYYCVTVGFPTYMARELELPSEKTLFGEVDVVLAGGRGGGCDVGLIRATDTLEHLQAELHSWSKHKPSAHCIIRALGDRGETDAIGPLLVYALAVHYIEVPAIAATTAEALADIGGPLVRKTALALTTSDNVRLLLIGVLVLNRMATARDRQYLWSLRQDSHFDAVDRDRLAYNNLWPIFREWGMGIAACGTYGCEEGWLKAESPVPLTADD